VATTKVVATRTTTMTVTTRTTGTTPGRGKEREARVDRDPRAAGLERPRRGITPSRVSQGGPRPAQGSWARMLAPAISLISRRRKRMTRRSRRCRRATRRRCSRTFHLVASVKIQITILHWPCPTRWLTGR